MHIVHYNLTTATKEGGVETFVWDLAGAQARRGHRVTIVSGAGPVRRALPGVALRMTPFLDRGRLAFGPLRRAYALRKLAERLSMLPMALPLLRGADLVHIHKPYDLALGPLLRGAPLVCHGHGEDFFPGDRWLMGWAAALLSCSSYNAATLRARYGREAAVVYNGVDTDHFRPLAPEPALRAALAGDQRHVALIAGRMMPWKGHRHAIDALPAMPGVRLVVIGGGETRAALEARAAELGVAGRVLFAGVVPHRELPRYFAAADLALGCSFASETFGMVLAEAMACALPVLASSWPGYDDVVIDGATGGRFPAGDPAGLAAAAMALLEDPAARQRYAEAGRAHVRGSFAWDRIAANVEAAYPGAIGAPGGTR